MQYIKLSDILELKSPYKELIEMEANRIKEATGGIVVPEDFAQLVEKENKLYSELLEELGLKVSEPPK